jgi:hypothetical protein
MTASKLTIRQTRIYLKKEGMNGKYINIMSGEIVKLLLRLTSDTLVLLQVPKAYLKYLTLILRDAPQVPGGNIRYMVLISDT